MDTGLVDLLGLSGDPESDDRAEKLLARLEADVENSSGFGSAYRQQSSSIIVKADDNWPPFFMLSHSD